MLLKNKLVFTLIGLVLVLIAGPVSAQQKLNLESLIPPAPNAAELGKYGTYPVGEVTGVPQIGFPLYEVRSGSLKLPISLSYHASGIRVNEKSTDLGLGWSLVAGGTISRTVYSAADDGPYGYFNFTPPSYDTLFYMNNYWNMANYDIVGNAGYDLEPDLFAYNFGHKSGTFHMDAGKNFVTVPFDPIKIQKIIGYNGKVGFQLTDDDGTIYVFARYSSSYTEQPPLDGRTSLSSWHLTQMISADLADTISFMYDTQIINDVMEQFTYPIGQKMVVEASANPSDEGAPIITNVVVTGASAVEGNVVAGILQHESTITYTELVLSQINFKNGRVVLKRNTARKDLDGSGKSLDEMLVYNNAGDLIRRVAFNHTYTQSTPFIDDYAHYRLFLSGFTNYGASPSEKQEYKFDYNSTILPVYNSYNMDYWGFYNGSNNTTLIPVTTIDLRSVSGTSVGWTSYSNDQLGLSTDSWTFGTANREPALVSMQAGMLNKVTYPTGGYTTFEFEPHKYLSQDLVTVPVTKSGVATGINKRTKSTNTYSFTYPGDTANASYNTGAVAATMIINFSVSNPGNEDIDKTQRVSLLDGSGTVIKTWLHDGDLTQAVTITYTMQLYPNQTFTVVSEVYGDNTVYASSSVSWNEKTSQQVTKIGGGLRVKSIKSYSFDNVLANQEDYSYGTSESGLGTRIFDETNFYRNYEDVVYDYYRDAGGAGLCGREKQTFVRNYMGISKYNSVNYLGSPILYPTVTKYEGSSSTNTGKTVFNFNIVNDPFELPAEFVNSGNYGNINYAWHQGDITSQTHYKNAGSYYAPVSRVLTGYAGYNQKTDVFVMFKQYKHYVQLEACGFVGNGPDNYSLLPGQGFFSLFQYSIKTGGYRKVNETKITYDQYDTTKSFAITTNYSYGNASNLYPTQKIESLSDTNSVKITRYKYPQDYSDAVSVAMVNENILLPVLDETQVKSSGGVEKKLYTTHQSYKQMGTFIKPDITQAAINNNSLENRIQYNSYDSVGNPVEVQKTSDVKICYIWDYKKEFPIAEVKNSSQEDVAYTSFEADGIGGWTIGSTLRDSGDVITGKKYYHLNNDVSKSGVTATRTYIISYWTKNNGAFSIAGTITGYPLKGKTIGGWTLYVHKVTGRTTISLSGSGSIDELRLYPEAGLMTTYTYTPLVGMTSQCDVGNRVTYYEYDGLQRLKLIRDQDYNILKTYDYDYQASSGCGSGCYTLAMQTFAGTATLGYPVGVFDLHGTLLGNATGASAYVTLWNNDTADARIGTLSVGSDSLHFSLHLNTGMSVPAGVTGCRYYQVDMAWDKLDAVLSSSGAYVDFGDSTGMRLYSSDTTLPASIPAGTTSKVLGLGDEYTGGLHYVRYYIHTYPRQDKKTITIYHNDGTEMFNFDNATSDVTGLTKLRNLRGNLPQQLAWFGGSCYQDTSILTVANVTNWNSIHSIEQWNPNSGDGGVHTTQGLNYAQDFMAGNPNFKHIITAHGYWYIDYYDSTFKLSRLKSNWNTYFNQLQTLWICDGHWDHEDLSGLTNLTSVVLITDNIRHTNNYTGNGNAVIPLSPAVMDSVIIQIAAGAATHVKNGSIAFLSGGTTHTNSDAVKAAKAYLYSQGWGIYYDWVLEQP